MVGLIPLLASQGMREPRAEPISSRFTGPAGPPSVFLRHLTGSRFSFHRTPPVLTNFRIVGLGVGGAPDFTSGSRSVMAKHPSRAGHQPYTKVSDNHGVHLFLDS